MKNCQEPKFRLLAEICLKISVLGILLTVATPYKNVSRISCHEKEIAHEKLTKEIALVFKRRRKK